MSDSRSARKERTPIIEKSRLAYQEFLSDKQVKEAITRIIDSTWEQAVNTCVLVLEASGNERGAKTIRQVRRTPA